ncbi:MAG TPA: alpha/beta hydrolase [Anaerolineaceae bacterium]|nr:alpha/beta hydrolase [Anaerolineaceae bacterium]
MTADPQSPFSGPMQPYPGLEPWSRTVALPAHQIRLHAYDTGEQSRPPILLLHGLGDEADTWRHVLPAIQGRYRVIAPDLPGFGRSQLPDRALTVPFFAGVMFELLDALGIRRAVLAGHSTGAIIAHAMALEDSARAERLILIGGSLVTVRQPLNWTLLAFLVPGAGERLYTRLRRDPEAAYRTLAPYYHRLDALPAADRAFLFQRVNERVWSERQRKAYFSTLRSLARWLPAQQKALPARLRGWMVPTDLIWGEHDQVNPPANAQALIEQLPAARLVIVPAAGHNVQQEAPQAVAAVIDGQG